MFFGLVALLSLAVALVARRPLGGLVGRRFRRVGVLWLAIGLHLLLVPPELAGLLASTPWAGLPPVGGSMYTASLSLLVAFVWLNRRVSGLPLIGLGLMLNTLVIALNGGQMPVDPAQLAAKGGLNELLEMEMMGQWSTFSVMGEETRLAFLGDWLPVPMPFRDPVILSPGDLLIAAGVVAFFLVIPEARRSTSHSDAGAS